jgi:hypothetical protein
MFSENDKSPPDWEMNRSTQRKFSIGAAMILAVVVLLNLAADPRASIWVDSKPDVEALVAMSP